jgi:heterodisulfide reductase subunit A-like polyferredoxin
MGNLGKVLVIGGGIGGMEASLNLVEAGFKVYLCDRKPNIGGNMAQLDKVFPTNDCSMCVMAPKLVEVGRDPNIELLMNSEVVNIEGEAGDFSVTLRRRPRRVKPDACTSCGLCASQCPLEVGNVYNEGLSLRSAAFINFPQAIPSTYMIDRQLAPCIYTCPINLNARDYVGLIAEGRFLEALDMIRETLPFPGIIGRICAHHCESACLRGKEVDQPIAICALKRFVADYEEGKREMPVPLSGPDRKKKVAIIGGGPAGVTCAMELRKAGYAVTIFDAHDRLGGMLYAGIPRYRLPGEILAREMSLVEKMGVEVHYNTRVGRNISLIEIFSGFNATFIASGAHGRRRLGIENEEAQGVLNALDFLRQVNEGKPPVMGKRVFVLGGGNVAMDTALTARRCGAREIHIIALERWEDMPAHKWEVDQALEEGIVIHNAWGPKEIHARHGKVEGVEFQRCLQVFDDTGTFKPVYDASATVYFETDMLILVIYETIDTAYLAESREIERLRDGRVKVDRISLETTRKGVFAGGNAATGPRTAIDAMAMGKRAAESIKRYFEGRDLKEGRLAEDDKILDETPFPVAGAVRAFTPKTPVAERRGFEEINGVLDEESAIREAGRCLSCRRCLGCRICEEACKPAAINYDEQPFEEHIHVGSIILSAGYDEFDASAMRQLGYGLYKNVLTSVEYERVLSATGPTGSIIMRPSDGRMPGKIAFIQCVGSRDMVNEYCSSVCCMYTTEEAVISREHHHEIEAVIFFNDIRAFGKGHDQHRRRAEKEHSVRYVKSLVSRILEDPGTRNLEIVYVNEGGKVTKETFDLVVLSVGLRPSKQLAGLAGTLGVELNEYGFIKTGFGGPLSASKRGIYACGACESPKDITETVIDGSSAASEAASLLNDARWKDLSLKPLPPEKDVAGETPRIGVFICNCGINIGGIVNVPEVCRHAACLPQVVHAEENLFTCAQDTQEKIKKAIEEHGLNRIVVASCSTRTHESLFRSLIRDAGLNKYLFEMANIRDQCSWVHIQEKEKATEKAKVLVGMAVANAGRIESLEETSIPVTQSGLVIGGGIAGITVALSLAEQGCDVALVEKEDRLGGNLREVTSTLEGINVRRFLEGKVEEVLHHPRINTYLQATVRSCRGSKGNFEILITSGPHGEESTLKEGAIVLATGGKEYKPHGHYRYGLDGRVITQLELEKRFSEEVPGLPGHCACVAMIQCVGSRNDERPYCSRVCCATAVKNSILLKEETPGIDVLVFYRDLMTYGFLEKYYLRARRLGVRFVQFTPSNPPVLDERDGRLVLSCHDPAIGEALPFHPDLVVLSSAIIPRDTGELATILKLPRTPEGFFLEAHMKLRPIDFAAEGIYLAGLCHSPRNIRETIIQGKAAAARAMTLLAKTEIATGGIVARVDPERCAACLTCVRVCPFSVPFVNDQGEAVIDMAACKGCGTCVAECPARAIDLMHYRDVQILEKMRAACRQ